MSDWKLQKLESIGETVFNGTSDGFKRSISVYINKPHVVNRRLLAAKIVFSMWYKECPANFVNILTKQFCEADELSDIRETTTGFLLGEDLNLEDYNDGIVFVVRDLVQRQGSKYPALRELVCYDFSTNNCIFYPLCQVESSPPHTTDEENLIYKFSHVPGEPSKLVLSIVPLYDACEANYVSAHWLIQVLLKKINKWGEEKSLRTAATSLRLVAVDEYSKLYLRLKEKFGKHFVEIWPERTDPRKFVYEDIAIATYLLLIWKADREKKKLTSKQSFVDMGCGNGLLVHILAKEGHPGIGLDIRRRKIWDIYGPETVLKEQTIIPSADSLFPGYDWLIGNHSDELTPWIPLIAARSSSKCCFFVLPCCPFDFDHKFNPRVKGQSPYRTFLNFVQEVGDVCGFKTKEDTLRIPSTKRVCFIGCERTYSVEEESIQEEKRNAFLQERVKKPVVTDGSAKRQKLDGESSWAEGFEPRKEEPSRNCQNVAEEIKELIVSKVFDKIMAQTDCDIIPLPTGGQWNRGGSIPMEEVVDLFDESVLKQLKDEHGGLQTLLRNHSSIFQVSESTVRLRDFTQKDPWSHSKRARTRQRAEYFHKTSLCWFHAKHPDGCPRVQTECNFAHGEEDMKRKMFDEPTW